MSKSLYFGENVWFNVDGLHVITAAPSKRSRLIAPASIAATTGPPKVYLPIRVYALYPQAAARRHATVASASSGSSSSSKQKSDAYAPPLMLPSPFRRASLFAFMCVSTF
jgi:hypothetical protein